MNPTIPKAELLERENRWSRKAGIAALLGVACFIASTAILQSAGGARADSTAELLEDYHEHGSAFILANGVGAVGYLLFAIPLWFLFEAASGRSQLVRRAFLAFAFIGPVLLGVQGVVASVALNDVADEFVAQAPAVERQARSEARAEQRDQANGAKQQPGGAASPDGATGETNTAEPGTASTGTESTEPDSTATETTAEDTEDQVTDAREDLADDIVKASGTQKVAVGLLFPGALGMVVGMVYIPLWCMRTGLLTRFWASLGMALGVSLILLGPLGQLLLVIWFGAIGLMLVGIWPGSRPPAWSIGEAVPWLRPGEPAQPPGGTVEGSGREISEPPLPEEPPPDAPAHPGSPYQGETPGQRRKKRKRRS
jgi:hypothetical protein